MNKMSLRKKFFILTLLGLVSIGVEKVSGDYTSIVEGATIRARCSFG
jgi:hypothetical protein